MTGVEIRALDGPVQAWDGLPAQHPVLELTVQVPHVGVGDMTLRPILLPPDIVQVAPIPLTELSQHSVLKKLVVPWPIHGFVAANG